MTKDEEMFIRNIFAKDSSGHDYYHTQRVYSLAEKIAKKEHADIKVVRLAALLHDVDDIKISPNTHNDKLNALNYMNSNNIDDITINKVLTIINQVSFVGTDSVTPSTIEGKCVQDADRLDAIGAIGIARAFAYGGSKGRKIYDPTILPKLNMNESEYRNNEGTSVNHFYEKLLLLEGMMTTSEGKRLARNRNKVMEEFLDEFMAEWDGKR